MQMMWSDNHSVLNVLQVQTDMQKKCRVYLSHLSARVIVGDGREVESS